MPKVSALLRGDFTNLSGLATWKWQKNMLSGQSGNMPVVSSIAPCGSPVADFFPADGFDDAGELADALGDPFQFVGGDLVTASRHESVGSVRLLRTYGDHAARIDVSRRNGLRSTPSVGVQM